MADLGNPKTHDELVTALTRRGLIFNPDDEEMNLKTCSETYKKNYFLFSKQKHLSVNQTDQHYYVDMDRAAGEMELYQLADTAKTEEVWVYVEYQKSGQTYKRWFECGANETSGNLQGNYYIIPKLLGERASISKITEYHIHPKEGNTRDCVPSDIDMRNYFQMATNLRQNFDYGGILDFGIISATGKATLSLDANVKTLAKSVNNVIWKTLYPLSPSQVPSRIIIKDMNVEGITATYEPKPVAK